jgi:hypothetical protein
MAYSDMKKRGPFYGNTQGSLLPFYRMNTCVQDSVVLLTHMYKQIGSYQEYVHNKKPAGRVRWNMDMMIEAIETNENPSDLPVMLTWLLTIEMDLYLSPARRRQVDVQVPHFLSLQQILEELDQSSWRVTFDEDDQVNVPFNMYDKVSDVFELITLRPEESFYAFLTQDAARRSGICVEHRTEHAMLHTCHATHLLSMHLIMAVTKERAQDKAVEQTKEKVISKPGDKKQKPTGVPDSEINVLNMAKDTLRMRITRIYNRLGAKPGDADSLCVASFVKNRDKLPLECTEATMINLRAIAEHATFGHIVGVVELAHKCVGVIADMQKKSKDAPRKGKAKAVKASKAEGEDGIWIGTGTEGPDSTFTRRADPVAAEPSGLKRPRAPPQVEMSDDDNEHPLNDVVLDNLMKNTHSVRENTKILQQQLTFLTDLRQQVKQNKEQVIKELKDLKEAQDNHFMELAKEMASTVRSGTSFSEPERNTLLEQHKDALLLVNVLMSLYGNLCDTNEKWKVFVQAAWQAGIPLDKFKAAAVYCAFAEQDTGWERIYSEKLKSRQSLLSGKS